MAVWRRTQVDIREEKEIIIGMISDDKFLKGIRSIIKSELLVSSHLKIICSWCLEYYDTYESAPKELIYEIFETKSRNILDENQINFISKFLDSIPEIEEKPNTVYALDKAENYLRKRNAEILAQDIQTEAGTGNIDHIESLIANFKRIQMPKSVGVDMLEDKSAIIDSFDYEEDILFQLPGDLGRSLGGFRGGDFVGIFGPAKRGKTWWLLYFGLYGLLSGLKVTFVSFEMTQPQIINRFHKMILGRPGVYGHEDIEIPYFDCALNKKNLCKDREPTGINGSCKLCRGERNSKYAMIIKYRHLENIEPATWRMAVEKSKSLKKLIRTGQIRLLCFPGKTKSILHVRDCINNMEHFEGYNPDLIITDYADFMASIPGIGETRHQINATWEIHRSMAQERNCIVVTGSHSHKDTNHRKITSSDSAEDGRKMNHITHGIGLNQTFEEKEKGIMNINILERREGRSNAEKEIIVLQSLDISKPYLDSYFPGYVKQKKLGV